MRGGKRFTTTVDAVALYDSGMSTSDVAKNIGCSTATARRILLERGCKMRSTTDGIRLVAHKLSRLRKGVKRGPMPEPTKEKLRASALARGEERALGLTFKTKGYVEFTQGPNKHRGQHVVIMESIIGRRLLPGEVVHHIDQNKHNNNPSNLQLMTSAEHARLHRNLEKQARALS